MDLNGLNDLNDGESNLDLNNNEQKNKKNNNDEDDLNSRVEWWWRRCWWSNCNILTEKI